jgi:hypothetical protein
MVALMSTLTGPHGETEATRVPRQTLGDALARRMTLFKTDGLDSEVPFIAVAAATSGGRFARVEE